MLMKFVVIATSGLLAVAGAAGAASSASATGVAQRPDRPMFAVQPTPRPDVAAPATPLPTWSFGYTYTGTGYSDTFVGSDPAGGGSTTVPVYIIPVRLTSSGFGTDPTAKLANGKSVVQNTTASPIFKRIDYVQGGTNLGSTQYIDAYQRANLWGTVSSHTGYHVLLGKPTVEPKQTFKVPKRFGSVTTVFGTKVILADSQWFDTTVQPLLTSLAIPATALTIFVTTQTYLTQGAGCCIGGYHSFNGTYAYAQFSYIQTAGAFAQDVSSLSHEVGEWIDDPYTNNASPCGLYETGDPLENTANYGDYPYTLNGVIYHLQDLATPVYFGAPSSTTVNGWSTFQGTHLAVCQNGS